MGKIVMPKHSVLLNEIEAVLKIYYEAKNWMTNAAYKSKLKEMIGADQYSSSYTKKSQITSYFGFTEWEDINNVRSRRRITPFGREMYEAIVTKDNEKVQDALLRSLETVKFGRDNPGCPKCDTDIEPPCLFIRAILDLGYLTYKEFAYLLWKMGDLGGNYTDIINELKSARRNGQLFLSAEANKYTDCKPIVILVRWGFLNEDSDNQKERHIIIAPKVLEKYKIRLRNLKIYNVDMDLAGSDNNIGRNTIIETNYFTPEWFHAQGQKVLYIDDRAEEYLKNFKEKYAPKKIEQLSGIDLLNYIFLNNDNKDNLCYELEYNKSCVSIFGSISNGTAYKYGLYFNKKQNSWVTGSSRKSTKVSVDEAIEIGTQIRDYLLAGFKVLSNLTPVKTDDEYLNLYEELTNTTNNYINRIWFLKYYQMFFPDILTTFYSDSAQIQVLKTLNIEPAPNRIQRMGQIKRFIDQCKISNVVFGYLFYNYNENEEVEIDEVDDDILEEVVIYKKTCLDIHREPRRNMIHPINFIVYGAPGTGKTYSMAEYALAIIENREVDLTAKTNDQRKEVIQKYNNYINKGQIVFTTFHQNYGYEDFIQGLRPATSSNSMSFVIVDGVFKRISDNAMGDMQNNYVIIIDEINRANISKVLGELITLIEEDKRWGELNESCVTLQSGDVFAVPNNLYIVGTMNSADKSISLIDTALRRRFEFIEQKPDASLIQNPLLKSILESLNRKLVEELDSTDLLIGHSFFINKSESDLCRIFNNSIIPLLYEYFYDNRRKVASILNDVLNDKSFKMIDNKVGRLYIEERDTGNDS